MKIKILSVAVVLVTAFTLNFLAEDEDYCLTGGGTENSGTCTSYPNMPSETDPGETVTVKSCNLDVVAGAPGTTLDCSGNALDPQIL